MSSVLIECPGCGDEVWITVEIALPEAGHEGQIVVTPDMSDLWACVWTRDDTAA